MAVYACSDLHGCLNFYKAIKNFIKPEDTVYFLGDAGDRGPQPWETIKAIAKDSQFIYLKGNHEDMLAKALDDCLDKDYMGGYRLLVNNGGAQTFDQAMQEEDPKGWMEWLHDLPVYKKYINQQGEIILLSHAGFTPWVNHHNLSVVIPAERDLIWDRTHYYEDWNEEDWGNIICVHGHTPIPYLWEDLCVPEEHQEVGAFWYADGHKVDIDTGAVWTDYCVLINLDTWEEHIFEAEKND